METLNQSLNKNLTKYLDLDYIMKTELYMYSSYQ